MIRLKIISIFIILFFIGCASTKQNVVQTNPKFNKPKKQHHKKTSSTMVEQQRRKVAETAKSLVGKRSVVVNGKKFRRDCSGFVDGVYSVTGVNLYEDLHKYPNIDSSAKLFYYYCWNRGLLHRNPDPFLADLIFFDNTYDKNKNHEWDDYLTHIAIVVDKDPDGTIHIVHITSRGIVKEAMNLLKPGVYKNYKTGKIYNNFLRRNYKWDNKTKDSRKTGELFKAFGTVIR